MPITASCTAATSSTGCAPTSSARATASPASIAAPAKSANSAATIGSTSVGDAAQRSRIASSVRCRRYCRRSAVVASAMPNVLIGARASGSAPTAWSREARNRAAGVPTGSAPASAAKAPACSGLRIRKSAKASEAPSSRNIGSIRSGPAPSRDLTCSASAGGPASIRTRDCSARSGSAEKASPAKICACGRSANSGAARNRALFSRSAKPCAIRARCGLFTMFGPSAASAQRMPRLRRNSNGVTSSR